MVHQHRVDKTLQRSVQLQILHWISQRQSIPNCSFRWTSTSHQHKSWFKPYKGQFKPYSYTDGVSSNLIVILMAIWIRVRDKASHNTLLECQVQATNKGSLQTLQGLVQAYRLQSGSESETQGWYKHYWGQFKHTGLLSERQSIPQYSFWMTKYKPPTWSQTLQGLVQTYWTAESETKHPTQFL